jgi:hypothetical protein
MRQSINLLAEIFKHVSLVQDSEVSSAELRDRFLEIVQPILPLIRDDDPAKGS